MEALALASGIDAEYNLIRESVHPLLVHTDSKVVTPADHLIKKGNYSASSRIKRFITNVNKVNLEVQHILGKARLNKCSDNKSRRPLQCNSDVCTVFNFVKDKADTVLDPAAKNAAG